MAEKILMPALSPTMEQGLIVKWNKKIGDPVNTGDVICEVETDKATMEYESLQQGTLLKILTPEGAQAAVGEPIAIIGTTGEDISSLLQSTPAATKPQPTPTPPPAQQPTTAKLRSTPLARKLPAQQGTPLQTIKGSGPQSRITAKDIETTKLPVEPTDQIIPLTPKRKLIAQRLTESKFSVPHYYLTISALADRLLESRNSLNTASPEKISLNAFFIKLSADALKNHPIINSSWNEDSIIRHSRIDIALAVALPDGLITPVVRDCSAKDLPTIDRELKTIIEKARSGSLAPADYSNPTFTISNLGSYDIEEFTAIINPPAAAILAIGKIAPKPVAIDNQIQIRPVVKLTLSCDHRLIDGATAAAFLKELKLLLQSPAF